MASRWQHCVRFDRAEIWTPDLPLQRRTRYRSTNCAVMRALHYSVVMKRELSKKAKLSVFKAVFVRILTYGHESWVMTKRLRSQVQASEMRFLQRIEGATLFNKVRSSETRKSLNIEPLLLRIERSQLRWFGHVSSIPQERLPQQALLAKANGRRPVGQPRTRWTITLRIFDGIAWDFAHAKWWRWWKTVRCGGSILSYCPRNSHGKAGNDERRRRRNKKLLIAIFVTSLEILKYIANRIDSIGKAFNT